MSEQLRTRLAIVATAFIVIAIWVLQHPYGGIEYNDSSLYSLLALARLHPQSLPADVFLRFGSQDAYTLFTPLYTAAIRLFDLEPAAASLAFAGQVAFIVCAWLFARSVMPARLGLLAVGLLIALPSTYGAAHKFNYMESFLTPRQLAEAATMAALAAGITGRYALTVVCLLAAVVLHPIMALAGIVMLVCLHVAMPRPKLALAAAAGGLLLSLVPILVVPCGAFAPFDPDWLNLSASAAPFLFLWQWQPEDWAQVAVPIAVLVLGASTTADMRARNLYSAALLTAAAGIAVNWIYADILHSVIFTQMQPWRWLWLVESVAILLLPLVVRDCWRTGLSGRAAFLLLAAAWMLGDNADDTYFAIARIALACIACATVRLRSPQAERLIFLGSCLLFAAALMNNLALKFQHLQLDPIGESLEPLLNTLGLQAWAADGVLCVFALVMAWSLIGRQGSRLRTMLLCAVAGIASLVLVPLAWRSWTDFHYQPQLRAAFAAWRQIIPQHAQVVWPKNPIGAWYLLERPSYYSIHQVAGDIFSKAKAIEIHRRGSLIISALQATAPAMESSPAAMADVPWNADNLNETGLAVLCADPELDYYVSWTQLGFAPAAVVTPDPAKPRNQLHLYSCRELRKSSG